MHYICFVYHKKFSADPEKVDTFWFVRLFAKTLKVKDEIQIQCKEVDLDIIKSGTDVQKREILAKTPSKLLTHHSFTLFYVSSIDRGCPYLLQW